MGGYRCSARSARAEDRRALFAADEDEFGELLLRLADVEDTLVQLRDDAGGVLDAGSG